MNPHEISGFRGGIFYPISSIRIGSRTLASYTNDQNNYLDTLAYGNGDGVEYEYGNPESDGTWTYTWEHGRQLASMTDGTKTWTYTYDADGMRTSRTDGDVTYEYVYNGGRLTRMTVGSQTLTFGYNANGSPMYIQWNNSRYFYVTNLQGDVTAIVSVNGICVVEYTYDAWGNVLSVTGLRAENLGKYNPLRYRGYVYDTDTNHTPPVGHHGIPYWGQVLFQLPIYPNHISWFRFMLHMTNLDSLDYSIQKL